MPVKGIYPSGIGRPLWTNMVWSFQRLRFILDSAGSASANSFNDSPYRDNTRMTRKNMCTHQGTDITIKGRTSGRPYIRRFAAIGSVPRTKPIHLVYILSPRILATFRTVRRPTALIPCICMPDYVRGNLPELLPNHSNCRNTRMLYTFKFRKPDDARG